MLFASLSKPAAEGEWVRKFALFPFHVGMLRGRPCYVWLEEYEVRWVKDLPLRGVFVYTYRPVREIPDFVPRSDQISNSEV